MPEAVPSCCRTLLYAEPRNGDTARCRCGLAWIARTVPHVGEPTWWRLHDEADA